MHTYGAPLAPLGRSTVLITDDDPVLRSVYAQTLRAHGSTVLEARDGAECLRVARSDQPDLILLDLHMPEMDGWGTVAQLKADVSTTRIPVIAFTGDAAQNTERLAREAGFDEYLVKPFSPRSLIRGVEECLRRIRAARQVTA